MEASKIEEVAQSLLKAQTQADTADILRLLKELRDGVKATEALLRKTRIGILVNKFKQNQDPDIARLSNEIVTKWRNDVHKQKPRASASASVASRGTSGSPRPGQNGTPSSTPTSAKPKWALDPEKRTWKVDEVDTSVTGNQVRDRCIGLMYDGLCLGSTEPPKTVLSKAAEVEAAAYDFLGPESKEDYRTKMRSLFQNLKNKSNMQLRIRVVSAEISANDFVRMTSDELRSAEQIAKDEEIKKKNMNDAMVAQQERSISTSLQCGKCGQRKVTYTEAQTRSADEPMTLFCTCVNCGKSWRQ
ncbi:hypothetical protein N7462_001666 [Penicillium macrosclerotiorum]|uniref:uncharacterized protein n=1 Tax=Penicillium macrosclerotiorum TaxID=303699 RepID=UPI0025477585|nr:uncharacterized protein N7462_001666 [Penicillium macrosclerotiorum]KAJ5692243.1 hypothetical protein N7462_001666 [Penicillium macrosclerotiorum]